MEQAYLMDRIYRRQRRFYDLTRPLFLPGRDELLGGVLSACEASASPSILEVGCGTGRNLFWLSRRRPAARLLGVDVSEAMLETAHMRLRQHRRRAGKSTCSGASIRLLAGDASAIDRLPQVRHAAPFDAVFFSYSLSMMPGWRRAMLGSLDLLGPRGTFCMVDFGDLHDWPLPARRLLTWWLSRWCVRGMPEAAGLLKEEAGRRQAHFVICRIGGGYAFLAGLRR